MVNSYRTPEPAITSFKNWLKVTFRDCGKPHNFLKQPSAPPGVKAEPGNLLAGMGLVIKRIII